VHFATLSGAVLLLMQLLVIAPQLAENAGELSVREAAMGAPTIRIAARKVRWDFIMLPSEIVLGIRARLSAPPDVFNGGGFKRAKMRTPFAGNEAHPAFPNGAIPLTLFGPSAMSDPSSLSVP
jgi:hypothetical protein